MRKPEPPRKSGKKWRIWRPDGTEKDEKEWKVTNGLWTVYERFIKIEHMLSVVLHIFLHLFTMSHQQDIMHINRLNFFFDKVVGSTAEYNQIPSSDEVLGKLFSLSLKQEEAVKEAWEGGNAQQRRGSFCEHKTASNGIKKSHLTMWTRFDLQLAGAWWCHVMSCDVMWCHRSRHGSWGVWLPRSKQHGRSTTWRPDSSLLLLYIRLYTYTQSISKLTLSQLTIFVATASQCIAPPARSRTKQLLLFSFLFLTYVSGVGDEGRAWEFVQALRQPREPRGLCSNVGKTMPFLPTHLGMVKLPS